MDFDDYKEEAVKSFKELPENAQVSIKILAQILQEFKEPIELNSFLRGYFTSNVIAAHNLGSIAESLLHIEAFKGMIHQAILRISDNAQEYERAIDVSNEAVTALLDSADDLLRANLTND